MKHLTNLLLVLVTLLCSGGETYTSGAIGGGSFSGGGSSGGTSGGASNSSGGSVGGERKENPVAVDLALPDGLAINVDETMTVLAGASTALLEMPVLVGIPRIEDPSGQYPARNAKLVSEVTVGPDFGTILRKGAFIYYNHTSGVLGNDSYTKTMTWEEGTVYKWVYRFKVIRNEPPVAKDLTKTYSWGSTVQINLNTLFSDPDGQALEYELKGVSDGTSITGNYFTHRHDKASVTKSYRVWASDGRSFVFADINLRFNHPPEILNLITSYRLDENQEGLFDIDARDPEGDMISYEVTQSQNGKVTVSGKQVIFKSTPFKVEPSTFKIIARDQYGQTSKEISVEINQKYFRPVTYNVSGRTFEDEVVSVVLRGQDANPDDVLNYSVVKQAQKGYVSIEGSVLKYHPAKNVNGEDQFTYQVHDGQRPSEPSTVTILITPVNDPPSATPDLAHLGLAERTFEINLLVNDRDVEDTTVHLEGVEQPQFGQIEVLESGEVRYTSTLDEPLPETIKYTISDSEGLQGVGELSIKVPPAARDDHYAILEDEASTFYPLENDEEFDGDFFEIVNWTQPSLGKISRSGNALIYYPYLNICGEDQFSYTIRDEDGYEDSASVYVSIASQVDAPVAVDDVFNVNDSSCFVLFNVTQNDYSPDGLPFQVSEPGQMPQGVTQYLEEGGYQFSSFDTSIKSNSLTYTLVSEGALGATGKSTVVFEQEQNIVLNEVDLEGVQAFAASESVKLDGSVNFERVESLSIKAGVNIVIESFYLGSSSKFSAEIVNGESADTQIDVAIEEDSELLFAADMDIGESGAISILPDTAPQHGTLEGCSEFIYTPTLNYFGPDYFTFLLDDGFGARSKGLVDIDVLPIPDPPLAVDDEIDLADDAVYQYIDVLANDDDPDGDEIWIKSYSMTGGVPGVLTLTDNKKKFKMLPHQGGGEFELQYTIESEGDTAQATAKVTVIDVNQPPSIVSDSLSVLINLTKTVDLGANDQDLDGDPLTLVDINPTTLGQFSIEEGTHLSFLAGESPGSETVLYRMTDGTDTVEGSLRITVLDNVAPIARDDHHSSQQGDIILLDVLANDEDPDGELYLLSVSSTSSGARAEIVDGMIRYAPSSSFVGNDTFTYTIKDEGEIQAMATVHITVNALPPLEFIEQQIYNVYTGITYDATRNLVFQRDDLVWNLTRKSEGLPGIEEDTGTVWQGPLGGSHCLIEAESPITGEKASFELFFDEVIFRYNTFEKRRQYGTQYTYDAKYPRPVFDLSSIIGEQNFLGFETLKWEAYYAELMHLDPDGKTEHVLRWVEVDLDSTSSPLVFVSDSELMIKTPSTYKLVATLERSGASSELYLERSPSSQHYQFSNDWLIEHFKDDTGYELSVDSDFDKDELTDYGELVLGLDPKRPDSDSDGIPDGYEVLKGTVDMDMVMSEGERLLHLTKELRPTEGQDNLGSSFEEVLIALRNGLVKTPFEFEEGAIEEELEMSTDRYEIPEHRTFDLSLFSSAEVIESVEWYFDEDLVSLNESFSTQLRAGDYEGRVLYIVDGQEKRIYFNIVVFEDDNENMIEDSWETQHFGELGVGGLSDRHLDEDGDKLVNYLEFIFGANPKKRDTDNDSYPTGSNNMDDYAEVFGHNFSGGARAKSSTTRGKTLPDESWNVVRPYSIPFEFDSDKDGMSDGYERRMKLNPTDYRDAWKDKDGDGLMNIEEYVYGSDATIDDSDGDGTPDKEEADQGSDPGDDSDDGQADPSCFLFTFWLGDSSGSHSENYYMKLYESETDKELFGMFGPSNNPIGRNVRLFPGEYYGEIDWLGGPAGGDHIFLGIVPSSNEKGVVGEYSITSSDITVHSRTFVDGEINDTGKPWPNHLNFSITVNEDARRKTNITAHQYDESTSRFKEISEYEEEDPTNFVIPVYPMGEDEVFGDSIDETKCGKLTARTVEDLPEGSRMSLTFTPTRGVKMYESIGGSWVERDLDYYSDFGISTNGKELDLRVRALDELDQVEVNYTLHIDGDEVVDVVRFSSAIIDAELETRDRMVKGTFTVPDGVQNVDFELVNTTSGQSLGKYSDILSTDHGYKIYDNESDIMGDDEIDLLERERQGLESVPLNILEQNVVIVRDSSDPRKFTVSSIFDDLGDIELRLTYDGEEHVSSKTLTADAVFYEWIDFTFKSINDWEYLASVGLMGKPSFAMSKALYKPSHWVERVRGAVTKSLYETFKNGVTIINIKLSLVKGVFNGVYNGLEDDFEALVFLFNAYELAAEMKKVAAHIGDDPLGFMEDMGDMIMNSIAELCDEADASVTWKLEDAALRNDLASRAYIMGYTFGYLVEQVGAMALGAGIVAKAGKILKVAMVSCKAGQVTLKTVDALTRTIAKAKASVFKFVSMKVKSVAEILKVREIVKFIDDTVLATGETVAQVLGERVVNWGARAAAGVTSKIDELMATVRKFRQDLNVVGGKALLGLAKTTRAIGPNPAVHFLTEHAVKGYFISYGRLFIEATGTDRVDDFIKFFTKADGSIGLNSMDKSLRNYVDVVGDPPKFKVIDYDEVHDVLYRYADSERPLGHYDNMTFLDYHTTERNLPSPPASRPAPQFTVETHATPADGARKLQINNVGTVDDRWSDCKVRFAIRTQDVKDDLYMSIDRANNKYNEPLTRAYTDAEWAQPNSGGGVQIETRTSVDLIGLEYWDGTKWVEVY